MNGKIARIEDMLEDGWDVEDVTSDGGGIEVLLRRGPSRAMVLLDEEDARDVLLRGALDHVRREGPEALAAR